MERLLPFWGWVDILLNIVLVYHRLKTPNKNILKMESRKPKSLEGEIEKKDFQQFSFGEFSLLRVHTLYPSFSELTYQ